MPALTVKNIPDELFEQLKTSAQIHRRSINSEVIHCLEVALIPNRPSPAHTLAAARALRAQVKVKRLSTRDIAAAKDEGRR